MNVWHFFCVVILNSGYLRRDLLAVAEACRRVCVVFGCGGSVCEKGQDGGDDGDAFGALEEDEGVAAEGGVVVHPAGPAVVALVFPDEARVVDQGAEDDRRRNRAYTKTMTNINAWIYTASKLPK